MPPQSAQQRRRVHIDFRIDITARMKTVGALLLLSAVVCAQKAAKFGECTFPDVDLEKAVDAFLQRLPMSYQITKSEGGELLPGLHFGNITLQGLSTLAIRGAPQPFCRKGKLMLQVPLSTQGALRFVSPWRYCAGNSGTVSTTSSYVTLNVLFEVAHNGLVPVDVWLTWLEGTYVLVDGASDAGSIAAVVLTKMMPAVVRDFWVEATGWYASRAFKAIAASGKN